MKLTHILAVTTLLSLTTLAPAQAAGRGGWDGNGTSVSGLAQGDGHAQVRTVQRQLPASGSEVEAGGRGGWDANGTSVSGLAAGGGDARVQVVPRPVSAAPAP